MTKDAKIVVNEAANVGLPCFMPAVGKLSCLVEEITITKNFTQPCLQIAHTQLIQACASGWTFEDDASVIKCWTKLNGDDVVGRPTQANGIH